MDKGQLSYTSQVFQRPRYQLRILGILSLLAILFVGNEFFSIPFLSSTTLPPHASATISRCRSLHTKAGPPANFHSRSVSDRFAPGTKPTLIKNAKIWTGGQNGTEVVQGDVLLDMGLIKSVGHLGRAMVKSYGTDLVVVDAKGAWVTPGIVDMHSHLGDASSPELAGAADDNSLKGTIQPWLRSLDGLNTHDDSYLLSVSGGVTTSLILPGSANAIGGQAFLIKLRQTAERSPTSMLLEPPYNINTSFPDPSLPPRWRHMKHACGENPSDVDKDTRMDTIWAFREAYNKASQIKAKQDAYCASALSNKWEGLGEFPEDLQWEALVDVLRERVKVQIHCYEAVDLDGLVRISNEFKFPISAFHHASEAYLVPDLLKKAYGQPPAVALFATNARYKREAYRASEFAPRILAEHGLRVAMKSDHPVLNSRYLLYEAQQAHFYGLPENLAIAAVTATPAEIIGMGHRIGLVKAGWDADLVIWDSHPLALGATPSQVFIDGIPQLDAAYVVHKPESFQRTPKVPNFDKEAKDAVIYEGLPPLNPKQAPSDVVLFTNVKTLFTRTTDAVRQSFSASDETTLGVVVVRNGTVACSGLHSDCFALADISDAEISIVDLHGGSISPGLVSFGAPLGMQNIDQEKSTNDANVYDPLIKAVPKILGGDTAVVRAVDGLQYATRDALLAYRTGVTSAITAPSHKRFYAGLGASFSLSAMHKLEEGSILREITGLHVTVRHFSTTPSVSTQIAALRRLLLGAVDGDAGRWFKEVTQGRIPLVVEAHNADIIATLILLKKEVELQRGNSLRMTITGAAEAHLLAKELGEAGVGVIVNPSRPFPYVWEDRRILPGPPLTKDSAISKLLAYNVTVGIGIEEIWSARNTRFDIAWASLEAGGRMSEEEAIAIGSVNIEKLLGGVVVEGGAADLVATEGGSLLDFTSKVVAVISPRRQLVDLL